MRLHPLIRSDASDRRQVHWVGFGAAFLEHARAHISATNDDAFVRDCYACLTADTCRYPPFGLQYNAPTPLEAVLVVELAHTRLANAQAEGANPEVGRLFHGAETLDQVSPEKWAEFTLRVQAVREMCAPRAPVRV
jgi:hypothetical protein